MDSQMVIKFVGVLGIGCRICMCKYMTWWCINFGWNGLMCLIWMCLCGSNVRIYVHPIWISLFVLVKCNYVKVIIQSVNMVKHLRDSNLRFKNEHYRAYDFLKVENSFHFWFVKKKRLWKIYKNIIKSVFFENWRLTLLMLTWQWM
jgi:hypothetical protein